MRGAYDDLAQESWNSADDNMPQEYLDGIMAQIRKVQPGKCRFDEFRPDNAMDRFKMAELAHEFAVICPRDGQPETWNWEQHISDWVNEAFLREDEIRAAYHMPPRTGKRKWFTECA